MYRWIGVGWDPWGVRAHQWPALVVINDLLGRSLCFAFPNTIEFQSQWWMCFQSCLCDGTRREGGRRNSFLLCTCSMAANGATHPCLTSYLKSESQNAVKGFSLPWKGAPAQHKKPVRRLTTSQLVLALCKRICGLGFVFFFSFYVYLSITLQELSTLSDTVVIFFISALVQEWQ